MNSPSQKNLEAAKKAIKKHIGLCNSCEEFNWGKTKDEKKIRSCIHLVGLDIDKIIESSASALQLRDDEHASHVGELREAMVALISPLSLEITTKDWNVDYERILSAFDFCRKNQLEKGV